ncbi:MAG TPA: Ldh family oxidoreductase [Clostridiaceae bacterium]|nr:Ldh family oxidoreductase [Clostridiaceae bacterium]
MGYKHLCYTDLVKFCIEVFKGYGFSEKDSQTITDVLLEADLSGIESHGIQRLKRYHEEITSKKLVDINGKPEVVFETPVSAVIEGNNGMGQLIATYAMETAIKKAKQSGVGLVTVRNSNHFGIAAYYVKMAIEENMLGVAMTNTEAIMVPTFGRQPMLGTNPIAVGMPAKPHPFLFDASTTVVPRGKLEVYAKRGNDIPFGWALNEKGHDCTDSNRVLKNIIAKSGGGILPIGGSGELMGGHKGYGFGLICELCTGILSGGTTSNYVYKKQGQSNIAHCFYAIDYGIFGDKEDIKLRFSKYLQELRDSSKAEGQERIYIHGEKEIEAHERIKATGVPVNEITYEELCRIAEYTHADISLLKLLD